DQGTTRHRLFVWDKDQAFIVVVDTAVKRTDDNVIFRRAMTDPELREIYFMTLEQCASIATTDDFLTHEIDRLAGLISDTVRSDPKKQYDNDRWDQAVASLRDYAARRPRIVIDDVARARAGR